MGGFLCCSLVDERKGGVRLAAIEAKDYRYRYADETTEALSIQSLTIKKGELALFIGPSGSGKTTFLRRVAAHISENKNVSKSVHSQPEQDTNCTEGLRGSETGLLRVESDSFGYVWQNTSAQLVCHLVEQEIAFGMENLGFPVDVMRRRLAEVVTFFGLENLLHKDVEALSAGEQQTVNIAAVALRPQVLLLDEPTSALDPMAAERLVGLIQKLHRETGITILVAEQRPELFFDATDRIIMMNKGDVGFQGDYLAWITNGPNLFMTKSIHMAIESGADPSIVVSRRQRREWLKEKMETGMKGSPADVVASGKSQGEEDIDGRKQNGETEPAVIVKNVFFRYELKTPDILRECNLTLETSRITALVGGNGSGKTTLAELIGGYIKPQSGKMKCKADRIAYLPADPRFLFLEDVEELSGGENELRAIHHVMERDADLYILDEPTKGLDPEKKQELIRLLQKKKESGKTVLLVTHDIEFAAECADMMAMMFDGRVVTCENTRSFLEGNAFYTTELQRLLSWD